MAVNNTMNYTYRQRYERYLNESDNRFASVDEVKAQSVPVSLEDLKKGKRQRAASLCWWKRTPSGSIRRTTIR